MQLPLDLVNSISNALKVYTSPNRAVFNFTVNLSRKGTSYEFNILVDDKKTIKELNDYAEASIEKDNQKNIQNLLPPGLELEKVRKNYIRVGNILEYKTVSYKILEIQEPTRLKIEKFRFTIYYISQKRANQGIIYEQTLTKKINLKLKPIIDSVSAKIKNEYILERAGRTKIGSKEVDIKVGRAKVEVKYQANAKQGIKLNVVFAAIGINENYKSTSFYKILRANNLMAANFIDNFYNEMKDKPNQKYNKTMDLSGNVSDLLFQDHYSHDDYIQIYNTGIYSIRDNTNILNIPEIKPIQFQSGQLRVRMKELEQDEIGQYKLQMKAELTGCRIASIYNSNKISLDQPEFLEQFVQMSTEIV